MVTRDTLPTHGQRVHFEFYTDHAINHYGFWLEVWGRYMNMHAWV